MNLPSHLRDNTEWVIVGPMGPNVPENLKSFSSIGVDGGANFLRPLDIWVGDHDSLEGKHEAKHDFSLRTDKDKSDLAFALSLFPDYKKLKLHMWGFLGGRKDHEIFNLGEVFSFLDRHEESEALFYGDDGKVQFHMLGTGHWKFQHVGLFSLGTLKKVEVRLAGDCEYPISHTKTMFPLSSFGLSNIGKGLMTLETNGAVFLYYPEGK